MRLYSLALALALLSPSCIKVPASITTQQGKTSYTADQIVIRVNELQNAAIQAEASKALPTSTTRIIVQYCVSADQTLKQTPNGWQNTVTTAWKEAKAKIPANQLSNPSIVAAVSGVDVVLAAFGGK